MSKIGLKPWQHFILLGILAVLVIVFVIAGLQGGEEKTDDSGNMFARFEIEYQNADSVMRFFYPGVIVSDSIRYEYITGSTTGFMVQIFLVGKECDYTLKFDNRDSHIAPEPGDTLIFTNYYLSDKVYSNFTLSLESIVTLNPTTNLSDELILTDYYAAIMCTRKDSCISISGVATASAFLSNPEYDQDELFIHGYFRADSIPIGKRTVN